MAISPYIRRLRECVGHERLLVPSVAVLVWDAEERLLLVRDADGGRWTTVGGAIEPDESPQEAAAREAREEADIEVAIDALRGVFAGPQFTHTYTNGDVASFVAVVYDAHVLRGQPRPDGLEVLEARWFDPRRIDAQLTPFTGVLLRAAGIG
jgi:8-oxo-dGTP pyrophosphatase MutT (NUDIX family)